VKKKPKVSIIINCLNGEKYLKECLKSVLGQSYKNFEIIFWDNGSTDNSKQIVSQFKDKRIKYFFSKKKYHLSEARNKAVDAAKGEFIAFLDVDDWYLPNKLDLQINEFKKNKNIGIVCSQYFLFNQDTKKRTIIKSRINKNNITQQLIDNYNIGILTVMIKKNVLKKIRFEKRFNIIEDFDFIIRCSILTKISYIHTPTAFYRSHNKNLSKTNIKDHINELKVWKRKFKKFTKEEFNFHLFDIKLEFLRIKNDILLKKRKSALMKFFNFEKKLYNPKIFAYFFLILIPNFLAKRILKHRI